MNADDLAQQFATFRTAYPIARRTIAGVGWEYIDAGSGPATLLMLPGALGAADTSFVYILAFAPTYRVVSLSYPAAIGDLRTLADGMAALLASLNAAPAHVLGGSYSGFVAQYLAAWHPDVVASLLLSNTGAPNAARGKRYARLARLLNLLPERAVHAIMQRRVGRFLPQATPVQHFWRNYFLAAIPTFSKRALVNRLRMQGQMDSPAMGAVLAQRPWRGPALIANAGADGLIGDEDRAHLAARMPQAQLVTLAERGHEASIDAAEFYIDLYREFLWKLQDTGDGSAA